jgi:hypothetical protein
MRVVESLTRDEVSNNPAVPVPVVVKVHQMVIGDCVWAAQDNPIISAASMVVVARIHSHNAQFSRVSGPKFRG